MKFTFDRDAMIKEIAIAQEIITNKSPISILSNILLIAEDNALVIKATDSTLRFSTKIPIDIQEEGKTTIYCDKFMNILSTLPSGEVEFSEEDIEVTIKPISKRFKAKIKSQTYDKFPETKTGDDIPFFEFPASEFKEMIKQTVFAVSNDTKRFFMTGCYFIKEDDALTMVATDGRRLSCDIKKGVTIPDFQPAIIPTKILSCIIKHAPDEGNVELAVIDRNLFCRFGNMEFATYLIDGQYPNYQKVIPESLSYSVQVNKADLDSALRRIIVMIDKKVSRMIIKIRSGELSLICPESESGEAEEIIPCRYDGRPITMALNFNYLVDPLKVITSENVVFEFNINDAPESEEASISKAVVIKGSDNVDYLHVIMPMNY